jgi:hypothetical protein
MATTTRVSFGALFMPSEFMQHLYGRNTQKDKKRAALA